MRTAQVPTTPIEMISSVIKSVMYMSRSIATVSDALVSGVSRRFGRFILLLLKLTRR